MIIDSHLHLDDTLDKTLDETVKELDVQLAGAGVAYGIILHLLAQPWSAEEVSAAIKPYERIKGFINVDPFDSNANANLEFGVHDLGFIGLKLHPRLQGFKPDDSEVIELVKYAGSLNIPVLLDAFPDGTHLMQGFNPIDYANLALAAPNTRMIWAHMGGHYVIDFMMLAKRLPNIYLDCSYSLLYYQTSSVPKNMVYAMRSMKFDRIFYGSDYPDRSIKVSLEKSMNFLKDEGVSGNDFSKIMGINAKEFFSL